MALELLVVLRGEHDRAPALRVLHGGLPEPPPLRRVERRGRLVQEQHVGVAEQRDREVQPLAVARPRGARSGRRRPAARTRRAARVGGRRRLGSPSSSANSSRFSRGGQPRRSAPARCGVQPTRTPARRSTEPQLGSSPPASSASSVDLPAPFGPSRATTSRLAAPRVVGSSAVCSPNRRPAPRAASTGTVSAVTAGSVRPRAVLEFFGVRCAPGAIRAIVTRRRSRPGTGRSSRTGHSHSTATNSGLNPARARGKWCHKLPHPVALLKEEAGPATVRPMRALLPDRRVSSDSAVFRRAGGPGVSPSRSSWALSCSWPFS